MHGINRPHTTQAGPDRTGAETPHGIERRRPFAPGPDGRQGDADTPLIEVADASYSYPGADRPALERVGLRIMPGERL